MAQALSTSCSSSSSQYSTRWRPPKEISLDDAKYLLSLGIKRAKVADILGVTRQTLYNRIESKAAVTQKLLTDTLIFRTQLDGDTHIHRLSSSSSFLLLRAMST